MRGRAETSVFVQAAARFFRAERLGGRGRSVLGRVREGRQVVRSVAVLLRLVDRLGDSFA